MTACNVCSAIYLLTKHVSCLNLGPSGHTWSYICWCCYLFEKIVVSEKCNIGSFWFKRIFHFAKQLPAEVFQRSGRRKVADTDLSQMKCSDTWCCGIRGQSEVNSEVVERRWTEEIGSFPFLLAVKIKPAVIAANYLLLG